MSEYFTEDIIKSSCTFEELPREVIVKGKAFTYTDVNGTVTGYMYDGTIYITNMKVIPEK